MVTKSAKEEQPVAWMYKSDLGCEISGYRWKDYMQENWTETPLYAAPSVSLIIDACVAIENLLYPEMADVRCDPKTVNDRLLKWIDANVMDAEKD